MHDLLKYYWSTYKCFLRPSEPKPNKSCYIDTTFNKSESSIMNDIVTIDMQEMNTKYVNSTIHSTKHVIHRYINNAYVKPQSRSIYKVSNNKVVLPTATRKCSMVQNRNLYSNIPSYVCESRDRLYTSPSYICQTGVSQNPCQLKTFKAIPKHENMGNIDRKVMRSQTTVYEVAPNKIKTESTFVNTVCKNMAINEVMPSNNFKASMHRSNTESNKTYINDNNKAALNIAHKTSNSKAIISNNAGITAEKKTNITAFINTNKNMNCSINKYTLTIGRQSNNAANNNSINNFYNVSQSPEICNNISRSITTAVHGNLNPQVMTAANNTSMCPKNIDNIAYHHKCEKKSCNNNKNNEIKYSNYIKNNESVCKNNLLGNIVHRNLGAKINQSKDADLLDRCMNYNINREMPHYDEISKTNSENTPNSLKTPLKYGIEEKIVQQTESSTTRCTTIPSISEQAIQLEELENSTKKKTIYVLPLNFETMKIIPESSSPFSSIQTSTNISFTPKNNAANKPVIKYQQEKLCKIEIPQDKIERKKYENLPPNIPYKTVEINQSNIHNFLHKCQIPYSSLINFKDLKIESEISSNSNEIRVKPFNNGTFCNVVLGYVKDRQCAIKCPLPSHLDADPDMMMYRAIKEWRMLCKTKNNPYILKLYGGVFVKKNEIWLVSEYIKGGDLYQRLHTPEETQYPSLTATQRYSIMLEIIEAIHYLHTLIPKIVHRDLKPNNILIDENCHIKLCDFGDAEELSPGESIHSYTAVTWQYAPPEIILSDDPARPKGVNEMVDIWSYGCILLEMINQKTPFWELLERYEPQAHHAALKNSLNYIIETTKKKNTRFHFTSPKIPRKLFYVIDLCLKINPACRLSAIQIIEYLQKNKTDIIKEINFLLKTPITPAA